MRYTMATLFLAAVLAKPLAAQQGTQPAASVAAPAPAKAMAPAISQWQSYQPRLSNEPLRAAVAADRDLTSEKIAIAVVIVVLAVVIYRSVK
jgi:hypothetical protein